MRLKTVELRKEQDSLTTTQTYTHPFDWMGPQYFDSVSEMCLVVVLNWVDMPPEGSIESLLGVVCVGSQGCG